MIKSSTHCFIFLKLLHRDRTAPPSQYPLGFSTPLDSVGFFTRFETKKCLRQRILTSVTVGRPWKTVEENSSYPLSLFKTGLLVYNVFDKERTYTISLLYTHTHTTSLLQT